MARAAPAAPSAEIAADEVVRSAPLPNGAERRRGYDLLGRLRWEEHPDGSWLRHRYDGAGHPRLVEHSSGERVEYEVADDGRTWTTRRDGSATSVSLDDDGLPVAIEQTAGDLTWRIDYRRDRRGRVRAWRYPGSDVWLELTPTPTALALGAGPTPYLTLSAPDDKCRHLARAESRIAFATGATTVEHVELDDPARLVAIEARGTDARGNSVQTARHDEHGRIVQIGSRTRFAFDEEGRLASAGNDVARYDQEGRLVFWRDRELRYGTAPMVATMSRAGRRHTYEYDASGRRVARHGPDGTTRYRYDLFGQLAEVKPSSGTSVEYRYDGFGRLVARTDRNGTVHYIVDIEGHRLAEADSTGAVTRSYVWLGDQCLGRIDGPLGQHLAATFHRGVSALPLATGDAHGRLTNECALDPFGADCPLVDGAPVFAGLFGDPATGLVHAGSRWLDPEVAQFLTPDTWYGEDAAARAPRPLRGLLDAMPGGTACELTPVRAYAWCGYDPVNATDPSGHNWLGLIFSSISSLLWGMQATSLSFQMLLIDFILDLAQVIILRPVWDTDGYWERSVYNIPAPTASYRLMVPWAFWFNGLLRGPRAFTLGNVIWYSGTQLGELEQDSERELVAAPEVATFVSATAAAAVDVFRARNPNTLVTGSVTATALNRVASPAVTTPAGAALNTVIRNGNAIAIRVVGAAADEIRVANTVAATITLDRALPASFGGQNVEVRRLDAGIARLTAGETSIARSISIVRGESAHFSRQVPAGTLTSDTVTVDEFLPAGQPRAMGATVASEQLLVDLGADAALAPYVVGDAVRILSGGTYFARVVDETRPPAKLLLDTALPTGVHTGMEVARLLTGGGNAVDQTATGARLTAGALTDLAARDGVAVTAGGAVERRIVTGLLLDCQVAALPAEFVDQQPRVEVVTPDVGTRANGELTAPTVITTPPGGTGSFRAGQPVEVRATTGGALGRGVVEEVDADANVITIKEDPGGGLSVGTAVTVTLLASTAATTFNVVDAIVAPGDHVLVPVPTATAIAVNQLLHIRTTDRRGDMVREVTLPPVVIAELDSELPASHAANLAVERLTPDASSVRNGATAPAARIRVQVGGTTNPYTVGEFVHIADTTTLPNPGEEIIGEIASIDGQTLVLRDPSEVVLAAGVTVEAVVATGITSADGRLGQTLVLIPSDPNEEPYTRREALENHEMRHVWQYAMWGPFFLSFPIPWLVHVGFSFTRLSNSVSKVARHVSVGGLDSLFALLFWGIGGAEGVTELEGNVTDNRRRVRFKEGSEAAKVAKFEDGSRIEVAKGDESDYEVVDALDPSGSGSIRLRFELSEGRFADDDTVKVTVSAFEQVRKTVSTWFSLNLENLWHDHIPTTWGRALSGVLNRDSWFPGLGVYVLSVMAAGGDQSRTPFEQDAAYHSGDLYTSITVSNPSAVFVGQFTRVFAFVHTRAGGGADISSPTFRTFVVEQLTVEMEGGSAADTVIGAVPSRTTGEVRFRENWYLPLKDDIGNAVGALLAASQPGTYRLHAGGELTDDGVVMAGAGDVGALETRRITVRALAVTPDPADPRFETESVTFAVAGDPTATYGLRFGGGAATGNGSVNLLQYTAPVLAGGATTGTQELDITAAYAEDHPVFRGPGQLDRDNLQPEQRTNLCQQFTITYNELRLPAIGPVAAGSTTDAEVPIEPASITVGTPSNPAAVTGDLRVMNLGGRPAQLQVLAPPAVTAAVDIPVEFVFGADPSHRKTMSITIRVTP